MVRPAIDVQQREGQKYNNGKKGEGSEMHAILRAEKLSLESFKAHFCSDAEEVIKALKGVLDWVIKSLVEDMFGVSSILKN